MKTPAPDLSKQAIKQRFLLLAEAIMQKEGISQKEDFAHSIGLTSQGWGNVRNSDKYFVTNETLATTQYMYPYVNTKWVLTGVGEMFDEQAELVSVEEHQKVVKENGSLKITVKTLSELLGKPKPVTYTASDIRQMKKGNGFFSRDRGQNRGQAARKAA